MRKTATNDEGTEHAENPREGQVSPPPDKQNKHERDGHVGQPDHDIRCVMEPN
jgi:hypothetical protein